MEGEQRLIDANALMKELKPDPIFECHLVYKMAVKHAMSKVKDAPTIDAVPVVRCKDCKHFTEGMAIGMCKRIEDKPIIPIPFNHYCSFGERRCNNE